MKQQPESISKTSRHLGVVEGAVKMADALLHNQANVKAKDLAVLKKKGIGWVNLRRVGQI